MTTNIFSVYDTKAQAFIQPFFAPLPAVAIRMIRRAADDEASDFHRFSGDYTLFHLGSFDTDNAQFDLFDTPNNLGVLTTHKGKGESL